jgi:hypothetical protein
MLFFISEIQAQTFEVNNNRYSFNSTVNAILKDGAGNTYVGGSFTSIELWLGAGIQFNIATEAQNTAFAKVAGSISAVVSIPAGGWYIGGSFASVNGITRNGLARINADGSLHAFNPNMGVGGSVNALAFDGNNLYVGGNFTTVDGTTIRNRLCQFDNTGALTSFNPNLNGSVFSLALNAGNLYVGGGVYNGRCNNNSQSFMPI